jgi:hypothetical protein
MVRFGMAPCRGGELLSVTAVHRRQHRLVCRLLLVAVCFPHDILLLVRWFLILGL